jgi:phosphate transport system substrate-binding protein
MAGGEPTQSPDSDAEFRAEAERSGLVVPPSRDVSPWVVVGLSCVIVAASLGVGYATGWFNPSSPGQGKGYSLPSSCSTYYATLHGSVFSTAPTSFNDSIANLTDAYTQTTSRCIGFTVNGSDPSGALASLAAGSTTFAFVPMPLTNPQLATAGAPVDQIPLFVRGITVAYNPTGLPAGLQLSASALAGVFLGTVTHWDSAVVTQDNPGANLSGAPSVVPVVLAGTTPANYGFSHFLAESNASWASSEGFGGSVTGPVGVPAAGDAGALAKVAATPGAIGYWETGATAPGGVDVAAVQNPAGTFTTPTPSNVTNATESIGYETPGLSAEWTNVTFGNATATDAYPVVELGFADLYNDVGKAYHGTLSAYDAWWLLTFFNWVTSHGEGILAPLGFVTPPQSVTALDGFIVSDVAYNGNSVIAGPNEENGTADGGETGVF